MQIQVAPSLGGGFAGTPEEVWSLRGEGTVFFGLYGLPDFYKLWRTEGKKYILWAGSDIKHFENGYWLDTDGHIRIDPAPLAEWINKNCESWVENRAEYDALMVYGIESKIIPSFLGNVNDYDVCYEWKARPSVYLSVSGDNFDMYGWTMVERVADKCGVDFHLYGNTKEWISKHSNVFVHGRMAQKEMDEQIKKMQGALRTLPLDGCSEIIVKSALWGQYSISYIFYPYIDTFTRDEELIWLLNNLVNMTEPNLDAREWFLRNLNDYPWNENN